MKKLIKRGVIIIVLLVTIVACEKNDESGIEGPYLTINGDTRELVNNTGDSEVRIESYLEYIPKHNLMDLDQNSYVIGVEIKDPNKSLINNFGGYNIPSLYLDVRFFLPVNWKSGTIKTQVSKDNILQSNAWGHFMIHQEISMFSEDNQNVKITDDGNRYIVEFKELSFVSNYEKSYSTISGRFYVMK